MSAVLRGAKGGSQPHTPVESPDNLRSIAFFRILDLVSEGEIGGLVNGQQSIYLDETPLANADGSSNFPKAHVEARVGTQDQDVIPSFDSVENEISVGVELKSDSPWLRAITDTTLSSIRVTIGVPALSKANTSNGDIGGYSIAYKIEVSTDGGTFAPFYNGSFTGKTTTKFQRSHRIDLPAAVDGWQVKVTRLTANANSSAIADVTTIDSYTEIVDAKLRYPNSALVAVMGDASQFTNIPQRAYDLFGRIIQVPSNYDVVTRAYTGVWDGTFKPAWTDNPAWIFYDLVTHPRYGLGHLVTASMIDKWELYRIGQYCDALVDDGQGGQEPRFTCNVFLQSQADAYKLLNDLSSAFRGISYWANGAIVASADMPADPVYTYTDANVINGQFSYAASGRKTRYTTALVSWNDPRNFYRTKVEYVEDADGIARYGIQQIEVTAVGCTSQGQAQRVGRWMLLTSRLETDTVTFSVGLDGTLVAPGQVIRIADSARAGKRQGGRLSAATTTTVTLDKLPTVAAGDTITVGMPDGVSQTRTVSAVDGLTLTVSAAFDGVPVAQATWAVESVALAAQTFRVLAITEDKSDTDLSFTITALQHNASKFGAVDSGLPIQVPPISALTITSQPAPATVGLSSREVVDPVATYTVLTIAWTSVPGAVSYEGDWRKDNGEWQPIGTQLGLSADVVGISPGDYMARIRAKGTGGAYSVFTMSDVLTVVASQALPTNVEGVKTIADKATPAWIINPNFADGMANWTTDTGDVGWYASTDDPHAPNAVFHTCGVHAGSLEPLGAGGQATDTLTNAGYLPVHPGEMVVFSCQISAVLDGSTQTGYGQVRLSWRGEFDTEISSDGGEAISSATGSPRTSTVIAAAPSGAVGVRAQLHVEGNTVGFLLFTGCKGFSQVINRVTDDANTTRDATSADNELVIRGTNVAGLVITIHPEAVDPMPEGATLYALQGAAGAVSFVAAPGVTFLPSDSTQTRAQGSLIAMKRVAPDTWEAVGDLAYFFPGTSVQANPTSASAQPVTLQLTADGQVIVRRAGALVAGTLAAAEVSNTPAGNLASTNVQSALQELDTKKIPKSLLTTQGDLIVGGASGAPSRLARGSTGQVPTVQGDGSLAYATPAAGGGTSGELLVADGMSAPPVMLTNESEADFAYAG